MVVRINKLEIQDAIKEWLEKRNLKADTFQFHYTTVNGQVWNNAEGVRVEILVDPIEVKNGPYR